MIKIIKGIDKPLLIISIILFALGLITIFSASNVTAYMLNDADPSRYFVKELFFLLVGLFVSYILIHIPTSKYAVFSWIMVFIIGAVIVILSLLGHVINGMSGWINYNGLGIQPSEFAKVAIIPLFATFYESNFRSRDNFAKMMIPVFVAVFLAGTIVFQGDLGTAIIFMGLCILMFFFSPVSKKIKTKIFTFGVVAIGVLVLVLLCFGSKIIPENKLERFNFKDPCSRYITYGNQLCNGYIAINGGGITGKGLGNSTQKYLYLPEAHTDFVFAIYVEETGAFGALILFGLYFSLIVRIIVIGKRSSLIRGNLICYGVSFYIFMHIVVNLTGVTGLLPMTGVPLPFMSYGGSVCWCLLLALMMVQRVAYENNKRNVRRVS
ncbi:MAG: FtsW/RodA/SpoVE family cell cycle protein [bacterium]|nr:FtsW/RodA/SpoVE family cell cycle protein [bacterium]